MLRFPDDNDYKPGELAQIQNHPVYATAKTGADNTADITLFSGRRWIVFATKKEGDDIPVAQMPYASPQGGTDDITNPLPDEDSENNPSTVYALGGNATAEALGDLNALMEGLDKNFVKDCRPFFFSEPVDYNTPSDVLEPTGLNWFRAVKNCGSYFDIWQVDESQPLGAKFICSQCNPKSNPCYNNGACDQIKKTCVCPRFYTGSLCEHAVRCDASIAIGCLNNGTCNSWHGYCDCVEPFYGNLCQFAPPTPAPTTTAPTAFPTESAAPTWDFSTWNFSETNSSASNFSALR